MSLVALAFAFVIPFSPADAAGNGEWDFRGIWDITNGSTPTIQSMGGDFKIEVFNHSWRRTGRFELWEYDPGSKNDDKVGSVILDKYHGYQHVFRDLNRFVDGSNDRAEFYVRSTHDNSVYMWD